MENGGWGKFGLVMPCDAGARIALIYKSNCILHIDSFYHEPREQD